MGWTKFDRAVRMGMLAASILCIGSCVTSPKKLPSAQASMCRAKGGFESRAPFGTPFCQFRYGDAGKACAGKADCQGRCLYSLDGDAKQPKLGETVAGKCEAEHSTFGCYGTVEGGKFVTDEGCWD